MRGRKTQTEENAPKPDTGHQESADRNASARNDQPKVEEHRGPVADKPNMGANDHRTPAPDFKPTNRPDEVRGNDHQGSSAGRTSIGPKGNSRGPSVGPGGKAPSVDHRPFGPPSVAKRSDKNGRQYEVRNDRPQIEHHFSSADAKRNIMRSNYGSAHRDRIPAGAKVFDRNKVVRSHYDHVVGRMGFAPHHKYYYTPYHYRAPVVNECYYGWYVPVVPVGVVCYWSPYYRYGLPAYIDSTRVVVVDNYIYQPAVEETLDIEGISLAKAHIRDAFCLADISLLDGLLSSEGVRACFDGEYKYTIPSDDFYAMSSDMVASTETISLVFDPAVWISSREVYTSGVHTFRDADGKVQTLYVSYRLRKLDGDWQIVEYGSSESPLPCPYNDFRNP